MAGSSFLCLPRHLGFIEEICAWACRFSVMSAGRNDQAWGAEGGIHFLVSIVGWIKKCQATRVTRNSKKKHYDTGTVKARIPYCFLLPDV